MKFHTDFSEEFVNLRCTLVKSGELGFLEFN